MDEDLAGRGEDSAQRDAQILAMKDGGATWLQIQEAFGLTRQQARYGYQKAKREVRRRSKREGI